MSLSGRGSNKASKLHCVQDLVLIKVFEQGAVASLSEVVKLFFADRQNLSIKVVTLRSSKEIFNLIGVSDCNLILLNDKNLLYFSFDLFKKIFFNKRSFRPAKAYVLDIDKNFSEFIARSFCAGPVKVFNDQNLYDYEKHYAQNMASLLGVDWEGPPNTIRAKHKLSRISLYPNINDRLKHRSWSIKKYENLIKELKSFSPEVKISIFGSVDEAESLKSEFSNNPLIDSIETNFESIQEFTQRLLKEDLLIISDCGPAHFASLIDIPTVVMFGPERPEFFKPVGNHVVPIYKSLPCSPCFEQKSFCYTSCTSNECMQEIREADVIRAIEMLFPLEEVKR